MAFPVQGTDFLTKTFNEVYNQYLQGNTTAEIDQLSANLALVIIEQKSAETSTTTKTTADTDKTAHTPKAEVKQLD